MVYIRSICFQIAVHLTALILMILCCPLIFAPREFIVAVIDFFLQIMMWQLKVICGLTYEVRGLERLPAGGFICACNHQSTWETVGLMAILKDPAFVLKNELRWVPALGLILMKTQQIWINRAGNLHTAERMLSAATSASKCGRPVVIFPEGTRVSVQGHEPFKPGVFVLYKTLNVPCVPAAVNSGLFWPRKSWLKHPGKVTLEFLEPIPPGARKEEFMSTLESSIRPTVQRLFEEARHS